MNDDFLVTMETSPRSYCIRQSEDVEEAQGRYTN